MSQASVDRLVREVLGPRSEFGLNVAEQEFFRLAERRGRPVLRSGWPDFLVQVEGEGLVGVEVKRGNDRLRVSQRAMFAALEEAGLRVFVWRPEAPERLVPWRKFDERRVRT